MTNDDDDDDENVFSMNETLFQTCIDESITNIITSTMLEGPDPSDSVFTADLSTGHKPGSYLVNKGQLYYFQ